MTVRTQSLLPTDRFEVSSSPDRAMDEYTPFISKGTIYAPGSNDVTLITIVRDTGVNQSILSEGSLFLATSTSTDVCFLIQGV